MRVAQPLCRCDAMCPFSASSSHKCRLDVPDHYLNPSQLALLLSLLASSLPLPHTNHSDVALDHFPQTRDMARRPSRSSSTVLLLFVVAAVTLAILDEPLLVSRVQRVSITSFASFASFAPSATHKKKKDSFPFPDFNKYVHTETLTPKSFGLGAHDERVIVVGDTHGMNFSLQ
ncbi:hypothetical protein C8Q74DRAFT_635883 [Fomes fomentarius]|nr:hypothetical protein C8Q74DRAFT_635883 [Fomes fomentarius]